MTRIIILLASLLFGLAAAIIPAVAQDRVSQCLAIARNAGVQFETIALKNDEARFTYIGHSTFLLESPAGIRIATDYSGNAGGTIPDVVTMNHAHRSHYTGFPDPAIKHVLRGWGDALGPARYDLTIGDVHIRNVTTDIRPGLSGRETDGNSIFIFETAGLCIGHLGHLHHELTPELIGAIGHLDVVMAPVDGGMTLPVENMMDVLGDLRARVILPMHARFAGSLERFTAAAAKAFQVERLDQDQIVVSPGTLPPRPTVYIMPKM